MDRVRKDDVRTRVETERELASRVDQRVTSMFENAEKMVEDRMARRVLNAEVSEGRVWAYRG